MAMTGIPPPMRGSFREHMLQQEAPKDIYSFIYYENMLSTIDTELKN